MTEQPSNDAQPPTAWPVRDAELLRRYVRLRDEAAFARLVERHSRLVLGVCRRVLRGEHDVEDAFQATFLVLARDAARIRKTPSLASWLHGVAYRTSLRAIDSSHRRHRLLRDLAMSDESKATEENALFAQVEERHEQQALDEELADLPDNYRAPLVLHYLDGKSNQQVADELGLSITAVEGRLKRGKKELRLRLARRGIGLSVAVAAMHAVQSSVTAAPSTALIARTIDAGLAYAGGEPPGPVYSPEAARLAGQEILAMSTTTAATLAAALLIPFVLAIPGDSIVVGSDEPSATISTELGADGNASDGAGTQVSVTGPTVDASAADDASPDTEDTEDVDTDPKPKHTELGTVQKVEITTLADGRAVYRLVRSDGATIETLANRVTLKYERNQSGVRHLRFTVFEKDGTERSFTLQNPSPSDESLQQPKANPYPVPRQQLDADAKSQQSQQNTKAALDDLGGINYVKQPDSVKRILTELDKETECEFVDTPLTDALGFIASYHHIPILPDTNALTNVGVSTDEPINLILKDVTLRSVLEIMLKPLGLTYVVEDDVMKVTTVEVADDIVDTRVYDTRQLGDVTSEQLVDVLENAIPDARWKNSDKDKQGGTVSAIDGGLVVMQSQSAHRKIANLLDQLRRKQLAEQQSGEEKTSRSTPQRAPAMMGGMGMGGGFGMSGGAGMRGGGGMGGGIRMGGGGGGGAFSGVPAGAGPRGAGRTTTTESGVPKTAPEPTAVPQTRLVIYNVDELAKSLIPSPKEGAPETGGGGMGRGGFSGFSKGAAINTITQIIQMGAQASNLPISSQQLPDGNIAVMTTSAGHELVEQTLETLREYAEQPDRRGNGFGGGGFF